MTASKQYSITKKQLFWLVAACILYVIVLLIPFSGLSPEGHKALAVLAWIIVVLISKCLPAMLANILFAILIILSGVLNQGSFLSAFGTSPFILVLSLSVVALGMSRTNLGARIAYTLIRLVGKTPALLVLAIMLTGTLLSTLIVNLPALLAVCPIILSVLKELGEQPGQSRLGKAMFLGLAWAGGIGGLVLVSSNGINPATIGAFTAATEGAMTITYAQWAIIGIPMAVIMLIVRARKEKLKPMSLDDLAKAGRGDLTQEQARQEALRYLDEANAPWQWEPLADQEGYGCSYPKSAKELRQSREALKKAIATGCADEDVAEDINMLILLHNRASGLTFNGWFPFVLVAFIAIIAMPIIKGDFWHMVLSWQYLGYWAGLAAYIVAAMAFRAVALRGKPVEELDTMKDKVANMTGATVAGAVAVGGAAVGLLGFLGKQLEWALDHSITHYRVFRNGVHVGNTSEMNPTGLIYFAIVIVALLVLLYIAWSIVMLILQFAAIYKFTRNYLIRR